MYKTLFKLHIDSLASFTMSSFFFCHVNFVFSVIWSSAGGGDGQSDYNEWEERNVLLRVDYRKYNIHHNNIFTFIFLQINIIS